MEDNYRNDIRRLLKSFGIQADEAILTHLVRNPDAPALRLRITLEDLTDYPSGSPDEPLKVEIEGAIRKQTG